MFVLYCCLSFIAFNFTFQVTHCLAQELMSLLMAALSCAVIALNCKDIMLSRKERASINDESEGIFDLSSLLLALLYLRGPWEIF